MTANEIRSIPVPQTYASGANEIDFLREIAAQLAELNAFLRAKDREKRISEERMTEERQPNAEKHLAQARIELEAAEQRGDEYKAALAEIHNRFCGENGQPCQVCRLKAEREEGK